MKYSVIIGFDANQSIDVVASTPQEAVDKAHAEFGFSPCHECSAEANFGEPVYALVEDESGAVVVDQSDDYDRGYKAAVDAFAARCIKGGASWTATLADVARFLLEQEGIEPTKEAIGAKARELGWRP